MRRAGAPGLPDRFRGTAPPGTGSAAGPRAGLSVHAPGGAKRGQHGAVQRRSDVRALRRKGAAVVSKDRGQWERGSERTIEISVGNIDSRSREGRQGDARSQALERARRSGDELRNSRPSQDRRGGARHRMQREPVQVAADIAPAGAICIRTAADRERKLEGGTVIPSATTRLHGTIVCPASSLSRASSKVTFGAGRRHPEPGGPSPMRTNSGTTRRDQKSPMRSLTVQPRTDCLQRRRCALVRTPNTMAATQPLTHNVAHESRHRVHSSTTRSQPRFTVLDQSRAQMPRRQDYCSSIHI